MDATTLAPSRTKRVLHRTRGHRHGPITRLMSPSDLGEDLKPFVFLDLFDFDARSAGGMPLHPHSGIATVTVLAEGEFLFDDPKSGLGSIRPGGVEWMRAGGGVWHGKEMSPGSEPRIKGFQLWLALPPHLENGPVDAQYLEAAAIPIVGPAHVILGEHGGFSSPVRAPEGITYLLVALKPGEQWVYGTPRAHGGAWLAAATGSLQIGDEPVEAGEMVLLRKGGDAMGFVAGPSGAVFVLGSAAPHPHDLVLGYYSVHTTPQALKSGEERIDALKRMLDATGPAKGSTQPVFAG